MDIETKVVKKSLSTGEKMRHLAYSLDGLTIAAVTSTKKLIVWDNDFL
jgi:hypothetical protein